MIEPAWSLTVGAMADDGVDVHWDCHNCRRHGRIDPADLVAAKGRAFSLWDQLRRCPHCQGVISYSAAFRPGNWPRRLLTPEGQQKLLDVLDALWWERRGTAGEDAARDTLNALTENSER